MKINLNLYASLTKYMPTKSEGKPFSFDISDGTTIKALLQQLEVPEREIKLIFVNGRHVKEDQILKEGDRVGVFPPLGGG